LIAAEKANFPITMMCQLLEVPRSTYYGWTCRADALTATAARRAVLGVKVCEVFDEFFETYGCRRIALVLNERGYPCCINTVAELMRVQRLVAVQPRAYKVTTVPGEPQEMPADLIGRDFTAQAPGQRLVGDITYLRTGEGWRYLATVIDLCTRMVVGWAMAEHMRTTLVTDALEMARLHGHLAPDAVFHSDRGTQYTSAQFARYCTRRTIRRSVGRTGVCFDNAVAESFFGTMKNEMYHRSRFPTRARARFAVADYIEMFYNRKRHHSTLGYRTPAQALHDHQTAKKAA
jgi:transposase InsO family protein